MGIVHALRLDSLNAQVIAFTGAGGKTSTMYTIAQRLAKPCLITSTTHLGEWQTGPLGEYILVESPDDLDDVEFGRLTTNVVLTGALGEDERFHGVNVEIISRLVSIAKEHGLHLLIEADGARGKFVKAPSDHEPVVPPMVDQVVVCASLAAVGKPLTEEYVHRPEIAASLLEKELGSEINLEDIIDLGIDPKGGLKGIPGGARTVLHLTQASEGSIEQLNENFVQRILENYDSLVLSRGIEGENSLRNIETIYLREPIAGIILAAGESRRFGQPKQLLEWRGKTFIEHCIEAAMAAGLSPVTVILGANVEGILPLVEKYPVKIAQNKDWEAGQGTSVSIAASHAPRWAGGLVFLLVDQPQIRSELIVALVESYARDQSPITAPQIDGRQGNPVLFDWTTFSALKKLGGEAGGRAIFSQFEVNQLDWSDDRILFDVDTPEDYQELMESLW